MLPFAKYALVGKKNVRWWTQYIQNTLVPRQTHKFCDNENIYFIYLFINCNTITNYILIIYELSNFDHMLGVMSQTRVFSEN